MEESHVVNVFLGNRGEVLLLRRSDERTSAAVERAAIEGIERAFAADKAAGRRAGEVVAGECVPIFEDGDSNAVYDNDASIEVANPTLDLTPADLVSGVITEGAQ